MDSSTKRLVDTGLNTVSMVAFAVPGGAPVGVALLVVTTLFEVFTPDAPAENPAVSQSELRAAVDKVKDVLNLANWKTEADRMTFEVLALYHGFHDVLEAMARIKVDHERLVISDSNETVKHFITSMNNYFDMSKAQDPSGILSVLKGHRAFLELEGGGLGLTKPPPQEILDHQIAAIGVYTCICSLTAAYLKTAVVWNWGQELLLAYQFENFTKEFASWNDSKQGVDPRSSGKYSAKVTAPQYAPLTWDEWRAGASDSFAATTKNVPDINCCATILGAEIQAMLDYCVGTSSAPGFYANLQGQLNEIDDRVSAGEALLAGGTTSPTIADMLKAAELGAVASGYQESLTRKYGLLGVDGAAVAALGQAVEAWRSVQASVMFSTHQVAGSGNDPLNTLTKIATYNYPKEDPAVFAQKLYDANPDILFEGAVGLDRVLKRRTVIKVYEAAAYPYLQPPK